MNSCIVEAKKAVREKMKKIAQKKRDEVIQVKRIKNPRACPHCPGFPSQSLCNSIIVRVSLLNRVHLYTRFGGLFRILTTQTIDPKIVFGILRHKHRHRHNVH